ncbi:hypothetical protein HanRHA438_Chr03g0149281 [Helianthus annuus]|nr:hypothetical protein HanRHA438_Chr03g0149281 [Helianthus annuus]
MDSTLFGPPSFRSLRSKCATMPVTNPSAALEPTRETAVQTSTTNDSCFDFMSLAHIASSIPANNNKTPKTPTGNALKILTIDPPSTNPSTNLVAPSKATHPPLLPPNLY